MVVCSFGFGVCIRSDSSRTGKLIGLDARHFVDGDYKEIIQQALWACLSREMQWACYLTRKSS